MRKETRKWNGVMIFKFGIRSDKLEHAYNADQFHNFVYDIQYSDSQVCRPCTWHISAAGEKLISAIVLSSSAAAQRNP